MTVQAWRRLRRILWAVFAVAWLIQGVQLARGANVYDGPWAVVYFVVFGLFLLVDTGLRAAQRRQPRSERELA
jgi:hypothetical protein